MEGVFVGLIIVNLVVAVLNVAAILWMFRYFMDWRLEVNNLLRQAELERFHVATEMKLAVGVIVLNRYFPADTTRLILDGDWNPLLPVVKEMDAQALQAMLGEFVMLNEMSFQAPGGDRITYLKGLPEPVQMFMNVSDLRGSLRIYQVDTLDYKLTSIILQKLHNN